MGRALLWPSGDKLGRHRRKVGSARRWQAGKHGRAESWHRRGSEHAGRALTPANRRGIAAVAARAEHSRVEETPTHGEMRTAIKVVFQTVFKSPPPEEWHGGDGTISAIRSYLNMPPGSYDVVRRVLEASPSKDVSRRASTKRKRKIEAGTDIANHMMADLQRYSIRHTSGNLAPFNNSKPIPYTTVHDALNQPELQARKRKRPSRPQGGGESKGERWRAARLNWTRQIESCLALGKAHRPSLRRTGFRTPATDNSGYRGHEILPGTILFCDETTKYCVIGGAGHSRSKIVRQFPVDEESKFCRVEDGGQYPEIPATVKVKHAQSVHALIGVAAPVRRSDGKREAFRSKVFPYTGTKVVGVKEYESKLRAEIKRVKDDKDRNYRRYKGHDNPCEAKHGDTWREHIKKPAKSLVNGLTSVEELPDFIFKEAKRCFRGTTGERCFKVYHGYPSGGKRGIKTF